MKLSTLFVITTSITGIMTGCYSRGQTWISECNKNAFRARIRNLCESTLSGSFDLPGDIKTACVDSPCNGIRAELAVAWKGHTWGNDLAASECEFRLSNEINSCEHGGESTISNWFFKSDPQAGHCW